MTTARPRAGEKEKDHLKVEPLPMPFESPAERGKWAAAHTAGTGHDSWFVIDQTEDGP